MSLPNTWIKQAQKQEYLVFIMSDDIQKYLAVMPKSSHLKFLRDRFREKTGINISEATQSRVRKAMNMGKH
jgi:hypothetical protein